MKEDFWQHRQIFICYLSTKTYFYKCRCLLSISTAIFFDTQGYEKQCYSYRTFYFFTTYLLSIRKVHKIRIKCHFPGSRAATRKPVRRRGRVRNNRAHRQQQQGTLREVMPSNPEAWRADILHHAQQDDTG